MTSLTAAMSVRSISKRYPGVVALDDVSFDFAAGEIHALAGENGAGKSTLIKVLGGIVRPDGGEMLLDGARYAPGSPSQAIAAGVRVVHQEFNLLPYLSVAENMLFERLPRKFGLFVDRAGMEARAHELLALVGLADIDPATPVERLGVAQQQLVEIARALSDKARILILDEPTATLTPRESGRLFEIVHRLKEAGTAVVFISHHLEEIFEHCDRVSVLRNGRNVATQKTGDITPDGLVKQMVGREIAGKQHATTASRAGSPALSVRGLQSRANAGRPDVSFEVYPGEIVGVAGLVGSGRSEVLRAIFGADRAARGTILRDGKPVSIASPADAIAAGICLVTENRKEEGLVLPMSIEVNASLASIHDYSSAGFLRPAKERAATAAILRDLDTRMASIDQPVRSLSGGNQQKVVLSKWLLRRPRVLMLDEPTRGIDVGAKAEIYTLLRKLAADGVAVIAVSSDVPELLGLADRILVLSRGVLAGEVSGEAMDEVSIMQLAYSEYLKVQSDTLAKAGP